MDSNTKKYIINNLKWPANQYISNYFALFFPFLFIYAGLSKYDDDESALTLIIVGISVLIYMIFRIESERRFKEIFFNKDLSTSEIGKLIESTGWTLMANSNASGIIKLNTSSSFLDPGQTVTIIRVTKEKVILNTRPNGRAFFTFFKDILNYNKVKQILAK
ncbi:hypothetical protein JI750_21190 [Flavobacterium sp. GN10]|uniref:YcxB-like protein domain-containing protein n=1 Tax=Flavobacterium tagetis TaxID=2801336 RepID=A0ABS1KIX2_9FLAO|nr:hypothetical protein [Flavobacterium tagetis]MBL0739419.1 hypothetical protein [Flavobacterium tagetis]